MRKIFRYFFDRWWQPILFWLFSCLTFGLSEILQNRTFENIALLILGIGLLVILISAIYLFTKRKWLTGLLNLVIFGGTILVFIFYSIAMFWIVQSSPDEFATNLEIPQNIKLEEPIDTEMGDNFETLKPDSITNKQVNSTDFQLYNSFQPGLYEYDFWTNKIDSGTIYLKAYEITKEYMLSKDRLPKSSSVKVYNPTNKIVKFETTSHFTIYEGDWGHPYAARFEVWFKPANGSNERKLLEKNYKIEGWQR